MSAIMFGPCALVILTILPNTDAGIFQYDLVNTMTDDVLAPDVARPSTAIVLTVCDKKVIVFHVERFELPAHFIVEKL